MNGRVHRPYRDKIKSITTVIGVLDKPGLPWGAANETAAFAVHHQAEWDHLSYADAYDRLRKHHKGIWDGRAAMGTLVHAVAEAWADQGEADVEALVAEVQAAGRIWQHLTPEQVIVEANGFIDGLELWWIDWEPEVLAVEEVVRHNGQNAYIGTCDLRCLINGETWRIDYKTTGKTEDGKGVYPDSWRLQLAALTYADEIVHYDGAEETDTEKNFPVSHCGIVLLRGDGRYSFYEVTAGGTEHNRFLQLCGIYDWLQSVKKDQGLVEQVPLRLLEPAQ